MAKKQKDTLAETAIKKAIEDVNKKIAEKEAEEQRKKNKGKCNINEYYFQVVQEIFVLTFRGTM